MFGYARNKASELKRQLQDILVHDYVIKWKHFPRYWSFVRVIEIMSGRFGPYLHLVAMSAVPAVLLTHKLAAARASPVQLVAAAPWLSITVKWG